MKYFWLTISILLFAIVGFTFFVSVYFSTSSQANTDESIVNGSASDAYLQDVLDQHNFYRSMHGVPHLTLNAQLNNHALEWAKYLLESHIVLYRHDNEYGENIYFARGEKALNEPGSTPVTAWYNEMKHYNSSQKLFAPSKKIGNFAQLIWKDSKEVGCGKVTNPDASPKPVIIVVCNYSPRGNVEGFYEENVPPPETEFYHVLSSSQHDK